MNHISILKHSGAGKSCLIIGGGLSVRKIDMRMIPEAWDIICVNNHLPEYADTIVYYDKDIRDFYDARGIVNGQKLIGFVNGDCDNRSKHCTHFYNFDDIDYGDTGYITLQFADRIFDYEKIYLIGYDYTVGVDTYHHDEYISVNDKMDGFIKHSIGRVLPKYETLKVTHEVYNCNPESAIRRFPFCVDYLTRW